ncbi:MAG: tRNA (adenosine(37)-N6)-threonylcarbamoyltransferase complex dimerization subunit type 1 TsaB [Nitrospirae bacterium]|nr:tRNA (adenosine(37)-N6)-threonylcarbamoyltransferase complex dimerization subunit type 1 TsaB [Nitrospirota bacterium]
MKVLSVDTSTHICRAGIFDSENGIIAELSVNLTFKNQKRHTEYLIHLIDTILDKSLLSLEEIDIFALVVGPGSYTGLRAGVSTIKGLAFALDKPIVPINTLEALGWNFPYSSVPICATIGAKKNEIHYGFYRCVGQDIIDTGVKGLYKIENFHEIIREKTIIVGDAVLLYLDIVKENISDYGIFPRHNLHYISISTVSTFAISIFKRYGFIDGALVVPRYSLVI